MAEAHGFAGHAYGDAGILTYRLANEHSEDHIGTLDSSRYTEREPRFCTVGESAELYPPSKPTQPTQPSAKSVPSRARREQQRWLLKSHPEAAIGNFSYQELLGEEMSRFKTSETSNGKPLFSVGTMPAITNRQESIPVPFLASVAGDSGEVLRLAVAEQADWYWGESKDACLRVSEIDLLHGEKEAVWATDGLPITQVKYAEGLANQFYARWLLVQKQTSTTILQPEYHPAPVPGKRATGKAAADGLVTLVKANQILQLHHCDTGGNAHSDVVFSPAAFGQDPLLAVIDECGFWSIWTIMGTSRVGLESTNVSRRLCGHIHDGRFPEFPAQHKFQAENHGILVISAPKEVERDPPDVDTRRAQTRSPPSTAPFLLLWNGDALQAVDMHSGAFVSPLKRFWAPDGSNRRILDVQQDPVTKSRVFILTEESLIWAEIGRDQKRPTIIHTLPHVGTGRKRLKMAMCALDDGTVMLFTTSLETSQMAVHWFRTGEGGGITRWHRHVTSLPETGNLESPSVMYQISVTPVQLHMSEIAYPSGVGSTYKREGVEFFQTNIMFENLGMRRGFCTTVYSSNQEVLLPSKHKGKSMTEQQRRLKKRRLRFLRHFENTFVLPDHMTEKELASIVQNRDTVKEEWAGQKELEVGIPQPTRLNMERMCRTIGRSLVETQRAGPKGLPRDLLEAIQDMFETNEPGNRAPLATWYQLAEAVGEDAELDNVSNGMETEIESLFDAVDENKVIAQIRRFHDKEPADALIGFSYLYAEYCNFWLDDTESRITADVQDLRKAWVAEVARNMLFSSYGVLIQDLPVFGPQNLGSSSQGYPSGEPPSSIPPTSSPRSSQMSVEPPESTHGADSALTRLGLLAPSVSSADMASSKPHRLLSYWPAERGHDTNGYISTVAVAADDKFRGARERLQRKEAKRKSHVDKFRLQSMMRQSGGRGRDRDRDRDDEIRGSSPGPVRVQNMSSQAGPSSSQTQARSAPPVTMSQPVSGAFGARKRKAKPKRKSGFR